MKISYNFASYCQSVFPAVLLVCLIGCQTAPSQDSSPSIPEPPDETITTCLIYSPDPTLIDEDAFHQSLVELSDQVTLLYLLAPNRLLPTEELDAIILIQKRFYRYGLRIILIDMNSSKHWPDLKKQLESAGASFPVAYLENPLDDWLNSYLKIPDISDNQLYMIDAGSSQTYKKTKIPKPWTPTILSMKIKQTLTSRSSLDVRSK
jgi:hypothetical protein